MTERKIRVAIVDDHPSIIDGYLYRLSHIPEIEIAGSATCGDEIEPLLARCPADVLILDAFVPTGAGNRNPYPILYAIPHLLERYPHLNILVISMHAERALIRAAMEAGASGYILKDDQTSLRDLATVVTSVASGGIHLSQQAYHELARRAPAPGDSALTPRQLQALSLCASYPDASTAFLARRLGIAHSTLRNLLSSAYLRLGVRNRAAALSRARDLGLLL